MMPFWLLNDDGGDEDRSHWYTAILPALGAIAVAVLVVCFI